MSSSSRHSFREVEKCRRRVSLGTHPFGAHRLHHKCFHAVQMCIVMPDHKIRLDSNKGSALAEGLSVSWPILLLHGSPQFSMHFAHQILKCLKQVLDGLFGGPSSSLLFSDEQSSFLWLTVHRNGHASMARSADVPH